MRCQEQGESTSLTNRWPLAWLIFVIVFFLNPLAMLRRNSRFWLLKVLFGVVTPGFSKVDVSHMVLGVAHADGQFITFFLADELNRSAQCSHCRSSI